MRYPRHSACIALIALSSMTGLASGEIDHVVLDEPISIGFGFTQQLELDGLPIVEEGEPSPWDVYVNHWYDNNLQAYYEVNIRGYPGTVLINGQETVDYGSSQVTYNMAKKLTPGEAISPLTVGEIGSEFRGVLALSGQGLGDFYVSDGNSVTGMVGVSFVGLDSTTSSERRINYGWIEFTVVAAPGGPQGLGDFIINQWAYESEYGRPILAGETTNSLQRGDFDADGTLGQGDLDYMMSIIGNNPLGEDDFNGDGLITMEDVELWITDAAGALAGDANFDGTVDLLDLSLLASNFGTTTGALWTQGDFNFDGTVDLLDLSALASNFGTSSVPEPTAMALVSLLGLGMLTRRQA